MVDKPLVGKTVLERHEVAKPIHIQRLEAALDIRPFMREVDRVLNSGVKSETDDDSDAQGTGNEMSKGDKLMHGVVTTKQERQSDRLRLYNFSAVGEERDWLKRVLLSSSESETDSDDETPAYKEERLKLLLKEHNFHRRYSTKFYRNPTRSRYMYYGAGLLSTVDRYGERRGGRGAGQGSRGRRGRPSTRDPAARGLLRPKRGRPRDHKAQADGIDVTDNVDWEEQLRYLKEEPSGDEVKSDFGSRVAAFRARRKCGAARTPEVWTARRRRYWQVMAKKELGKVQRARANNHKEATLQKKRLANLCAKHWRHYALQSQKNMKETIWRCKRLSREMQSYWKRYDRAERETRRRMEKEAEEQRKMDVELMEAKRQRRKLNFLITQTELYAHFMQRKLGDAEVGAESILRQLDEDRDPRLAAIDHYDSEAMKAKASRNAREAFQVEKARAMQFDAVTNPRGVDNRGGDFQQPSIFRGTLKGYQLKGMNWLANLYDQGISGILADEMGLGKTVQCIAFLCHVAERLGVWGPFLVVSPASTLHNWQQEVQRFAPDFKVVPYWGSPSERRILRQFWERKDLHTPSAAFHVVVTSYQIVVSDLKYLNRVAWQHMILDEAQAIKSSASIRWKLLLGFSCRNRLLLSGTPIQNSMAELWALLHFIMPTLFDSHDEFNEWFSKDIESHAENKTTIDEKHLSRLHMILKPFMLRRIKKDVENELSDKIEIMVHCPLTIRQKLLYIALKKKIKIEELLSVSGETGHSGDKNFTSNLMNLVMQFRKVCNHPELFERRDVRSPFAMHVDDFSMPRLVDDAILVRAVPSRRHLLYNKLSAHTPPAVCDSLATDGAHAFTRFVDLSPMDVYRIMLCGWLCMMNHIDECADKFDKLRHRQLWWRKWHNGATQPDDSSSYDDELTDYYRAVHSKDLLHVCPDGDILQQRKEDGIMWRELLFADPVWNDCNGFFFSYGDHVLHYMPETLEHRAMRARHARGQSRDQAAHEGEEQSTKIEEVAEEFPHVEREPYTRYCQRTTLPDYLFSVSPKAVCSTRGAYCASRAAAHRRLRHERCGGAAGYTALRRLLECSRPPRTHPTLHVPDKNQLVSDAGKLTVLDSLLRRLKERGHRVLIYSQMTKMIDLLEEYMWHRKHKYMRLDGSSKISARRDMVADFQARSDIFVFLLSTRAGGLGINLTAADTVIFYDSDWNPTVDQQAMDRAHRLGQTKQVTVYRLICKGTIEERIMQRAREKSEIQRMVISGGNFKPDTLKPKEVVSLLLDDDELEQKYRIKSEEKRINDDRERKRKQSLIGISTSAPSHAGAGAVAAAAAAPASEAKRSRDSPSEGGSGAGSPVRDDDSCDALVVADSPPPAAPPHKHKPFVSSWSIRRTMAGRGGARRGRPRGSRHGAAAGLQRHRPHPAPHPHHEHANMADMLAAGAALLQGDEPLEGGACGGGSAEGAGGTERARVRRGPGRPRLRAGAAPPHCTSVGGRSGLRRPRRPREPLLVPLAAPHVTAHAATPPAPHPSPASHRNAPL